MTAPAPFTAADLGIPPGFLWGASTSSYQIEGGADADGRGPSIWDVFCKMKGRIENGDTGDVACDHYHRYAEDVGLMKDLGLGAYRFSIAWPRVMPTGRGAVNPAGLDFYDRLIDALLAKGIEPWICLYHWDLPQGLGDLGGWADRDTAFRFADYAALCASRYGDRVRRWATFNEFSVFTLFGYGFGWGAPGISDRSLHLRAIHHTNLAHGLGVDVLRELVPDASIGAVHNRQPVLPETDTPENAAACALFDEHWNLAFTDPQLLGHYPPLIAAAIAPHVLPGDMARIRRPLDWFGLNHYSPIYAKADPAQTWGFTFGGAPEEAPRTDIGWPIHPEAFRDTLIELGRRYRLPIYVTENGCGTGSDDKPDAEGRVVDTQRVAYLRSYIRAMAEAMRAGADVRGYFVWSLLDNFEWGAGYGNRFGVVYVDFETLQRTPKASAAWYAALARGEAVD